MAIVKLPKPIRWFWASLAAYAVTDIINPGFFSIAIMALVMIPILVADMYFPPKS